VRLRRCEPSRTEWNGDGDGREVGAAQHVETAGQSRRLPGAAAYHELAGSISVSVS
jgi:hypothetical protein